MSETLTPETDAAESDGFDGTQTLVRPEFVRKLEIDRNRWRSVAEQAEKALKDSLSELGSYKRMLIYEGESQEDVDDLKSTIKQVEEALSAFDSLRKEQGL